ncbi:alcohol dehydrogenase catalytic domain-containing protein [Mesorhizobium sp. M0809]|uniref:zinc-dependent alcohol dehydrogenase n=1 Tax=Mesorhizobium sp. M0809 TaxID=2957003 RepID=UPI00333BF0D5
MTEKANTVARLVSPRRLVLTCDGFSEELPPDFVRIKIEFCGVCGTDRSFYLGHRDEGYPVSLGHEHCGSVVAVGNQVTSYEVGDFVAIDPNFRCERCHYCRIGESHLCENSAINRYTNRGFARFTDINTAYLVKMPRYRHKHLASLVEPLSVAINATSISKCRSDAEAALVIGVGGIGTLLVFNLLESQEGEIWICDNAPHKMAALKNLYPDRIKILESADARVFDVIFEASGSSNGFQHACARLAKLGRLIVVSRYHSDEPPVPDRLPWKQPTLYFVHLNGHRDTFIRAANLIKDRWSFDHDALLSLHCIEDINQVFADYESLSANKKIISMTDAS